MPARYMAVLDAGSTILKLALFIQDIDTKQQHFCASWVTPRLLFESSLQGLLDQAKAWLTIQESTATFDIAVVGHYPEVANLSTVKWKITHEQALTAAAQRLSSTSTVVIVDVGSKQTLVALAKYGKVSVQAFPHGVGLEAWNIVRQTGGLDSVRAWLALDIEDSAIENYLANKSLYSELIPSTNEELMIEQAVAKAILHGIGQQINFPWPEVNMVVATGAVLTQTPIAAQTASMILDGITPTGTVQLVADDSLILLTCGGAFEAWSASDYRVGRSMLHQALQPIGTIVGLETPATNRQKLAKVTLDLGLDHNQVLEVKAGDLLQLPLLAEDEGSLQIVGSSNQTKNESEQQARGGQVGLIIDGRGRPLAMSANDNERRAQLMQWDRQLNAHHQYGSIGEIS